MKRLLTATAAIVLCLLVVLTACRRTDIRTTTVSVPEMATTQDVRIITNAALNEIIAEYDGMMHEYEVDLTKKLIVYHESSRLAHPQYRHHIEARIAEVGFKAKVQTGILNPPPLVETVDGMFQEWPGRFTSVISVPDMTSTIDANIVVDAIGFARVGRDAPLIKVNPESRTVHVTYQGMTTNKKNIEHAIALSGYSANEVQAALGRPSALPHGWKPANL
jgi:copper chaperone CopZ